MPRPKKKIPNPRSPASGAVHRSVDDRLPDLLVDFIRAERLKPHQTFLSRREVSDRWRVGLTRVHEVFNALENQGVLYSLPRKGTFVSPVVRHQQILIVTGATARQVLGMGSVADFMSGCQEAVGGGGLPYAIVPISFQEIAEHLGDFSVAFPRVAGLVFFRRHPWVLDFRSVAANGAIPTAFYGSDTWKSRLDGVHGLYYEEASLLTPVIDHLVERGHRKFLFAGRGDDLVDRRRGFFLERLAHHGIEAPTEELRYEMLPEPAARYRDMEARIRALSNRPSAIVCADDQTATLVVHALARLGLRVPGEIAVTGIDNAPCSREALVPITTVEIPVFEDAQRLMSAFIQSIERGADAPRVNLTSPVHLITRESTVPETNEPSNGGL